MKKVFLFWLVIVWLNATYSFLTLIQYPVLIDIIASISAIFTFVIIYTLIDNSLIKNHYHNLSKSLRIGASIKILTQFYPIIEASTGIVGIRFVELLILDKVIFINMYFATLVSGFLLSIIVAIFTTIINFIINKNEKNNITAN